MNIFHSIIFNFSNEVNALIYINASFVWFIAVVLLLLAFLLSNLKKPSILQRTEGFEVYEFGATSIGNSSLLSSNNRLNKSSLKWFVLSKLAFYCILATLFIIFSINLVDINLLSFMFLIPFKNFNEPFIISGSVPWYIALSLQLFTIIFLLFYEYRQLNKDYQKIKLTTTCKVGYTSLTVILTMVIINNILLTTAIIQLYCIYYFLSIETLLYSIGILLIIFWFSFFLTYTIVYIILTAYNIYGIGTNSNFLLLPFFKNLQKRLIYLIYYNKLGNFLFHRLNYTPSHPLYRTFFFPYWLIFYILSFFFQLNPEMHLIKDSAAFYNKILFFRKKPILWFILIIFLLLSLFIIIPETLYYTLHNPFKK